MNAHTQSLTLQGPAGAIEALLDEPAAPAAFANGVVPVAVIAHPHPLFSGSMHNKVVQTLARAFVAAGWRAVRFNFRGVGESAGAYDKGEGEAQDMLSVIEQFAPRGPLAIAGFSFGSFVASHVAETLHRQGRDVAQLVFVGTAAQRFTVAPIPPEWHARTLVLHGEVDDTVSLASVLDWARPQGLPVTVLPGVEHFFHGKLPLLKQLVLRHLMVPPGAE